MKFFLKTVLLFMAVICLFLTSACDEDDPTVAPKVIDPTANQTFSQNYEYIDGLVKITVSFTKEMNTSTLEAGKTYFVEGYQGSSWVTVPVTASWSADKKILTIMSNNSAFNWCSFSPDCHFRLRLIGTDAGNGTLKDADGNSLDGDSNDTAGGDYQTTFGILG